MNNSTKEFGNWLIDSLRIAQDKAEQKYYEYELWLMVAGADSGDDRADNERCIIQTNNIDEVIEAIKEHEFDGGFDYFSLISLSYNSFTFYDYEDFERYI